MIGICVKLGARVTCQSRTGEAVNINRDFLFLNVNRELDKFTSSEHRHFMLMLCFAVSI